MITLRILQARARRSVRCWQQHETEAHAREARLAIVLASLAAAVEDGVTQMHAGADSKPLERRIVDIAGLLAGDPNDPEMLPLVERWLEEYPEDDDIVQDLYAALLVVEGGAVTEQHWLRAGEVLS